MPEFLVLFRRAGITQERDGLVWPSNLEHEEARLGAPDWTRTSTPSRAQALNLLRIPIPPQGLYLLLYCLPDDLSTRQGHRTDLLLLWRSLGFHNLTNRMKWGIVKW